MPSSWPWLVLLKIRNCSWNAEFFLLHTYLQFIELTSDWIQISINRYLVVWKWTHCLLIVYCPAFKDTPTGDHRTQTQSKLLVKHLYNSGIKYVTSIYVKKSWRKFVFANEYKGTTYMSSHFSRSQSFGPSVRNEKHSQP